MMRGAGVFARVLIGRAVATVRRAAFLARPQVNPARATLDAFVAFALFRMSYVVDGCEMRAGFCRHDSLNPLIFFTAREFSILWSGRGKPRQEHAAPESRLIPSVGCRS